MRAHASCDWAACVEPLSSFSHLTVVPCAHCPLLDASRLGLLWGVGKRDSPTRCPLLPLNAGTAEPFRVSPPEAVAYHLELRDTLISLILLCVKTHHKCSI